MNQILYFTSYYPEKDPARKAEIDLCIDKVLKNPDIDKVYLVCENIDFPYTDSKLEIISTNIRPTYQFFFNLMNEVGSDMDVMILANSDIYPSGDVKRLFPMPRGFAYAISRWDTDKDKAELYDRRDSQDVWAFQHPVLIADADFPMGVPGCDNKIAHVIKQAKYTIKNPSRSFRFFHVHESNIRNYSDKDRLKGPFDFVYPSYQHNKNYLGSVLHVGFSQPPLERAFKEASSDYEFVQWTDYQKDPGALRGLILELCQTKPRDMIFFHIQTEGIITPEFIQKLRKAAVNNPLIINWSGDVRTPLPKWYLDVGREIDLTLFSNEHDLQEFQSRGIRAKYLQIGFDTEFFYPKKTGNKWPEIVFLGNHYPNHFPLSKFRLEMVQFLKKTYGDRFGLYGSGWKGLENGNLMNQLEKEADCYRGCKIAINLSHFNYERYTSDRMFRAMGAGAFCLTHNYSGIERDYVIGKHLEVWNSLPILKVQIDKYLDDDNAREDIAHHGCTLVHAQHTWDYRLKEMIRLIKTI